jgi:hypothetical protein
MENGLWFLGIKFMRIFRKIFGMNGKPKTDEPSDHFWQISKKSGRKRRKFSGQKRKVCGVPSSLQRSSVIPPMENGLWFIGRKFSLL